ncbi:MAG: hypothetical protein LKM31_14195 [Sphingobium sp.]|jgi:ribosomal protein L27|nr:hypothetical protein [Sphingobium sp.]
MLGRRDALGRGWAGGAAGDVLARVSREAAKTRDITGGLPRVAELFEARKPKDNAIIAKVSGRVEFLKDYKAKRKIHPAGGRRRGDRVSDPQVQGDRRQEGDYVKKGDNLIGRLAGPARHSGSARHRGAGRISRVVKSRKSIACRA